MIITILNSGSNFGGVEYSEKKIKKEEAKFLLAENFDKLPVSPGKETSGQEYRDFLESYSNTNSVVKNKQFHVAISVKGNSMNIEQLKDAAKEYLKHMGYDKQPYMFYSHHDTANNHIHIVTSRIGEDGKKINDSFEKLRSRAFIKEYLGIDYSQEIDGLVKDANKYKYQTTGQYISLLEQLGVKASIKDDKVKLYKDGETVKEVGLKDVEKYISKDYDKQRAKQFTAVFYKYSETLNQEEFKKILKDRLGATVMFHKGEDKTKPYGFTVIDNKNKEIFKGSQIFKLATLLERFNAVEEKRKSFDLKGFVSKAGESSLSFKELKETLSKEGLDVDRKGVVSYKNGSEVGITLDEDLLKELKYQDRVNAAKLFTVSNTKEKELLGKLFYLNKEDISNLTLSKDREGKYDKDYYETLLKTLSANEESLKGQLNDLKMELVKYKGEHFIVDNDAKTISSIDLEFTQKEKEDIKTVDGFFEKDGVERELNEKDLSEKISVSGIVDTISSLFHYGGEEEGERKKKKKKGITR